MKITLFSKDVENISKLSDRPNIENGYTANALKEIFDKAGVDIKEYINNVLIEELASRADHYSGADKIGSGTIDTVPGETLQDKLVVLSAQVNDLANGTIPDGSVTPDKFSPEVAAFLTSASIRAKMFTKVGSNTFTVPRDGTYKFTVVGAGAGGGVDNSLALRKQGGGSGAVAVLWIDLRAGDVCVMSIGEGGEGQAVDGTNLVDDAKDGGSTTLTINGVTVATAGGGLFGMERRAVAMGGTYNISGGYPKAEECYGNTFGDMEFSIGGDTILGNGGAFADDAVGIGGGGYAGRYIGSGIYYKGYRGGDGAVLVEYMN